MSTGLLAPLSGEFGAASAAELALVGAACGAVGVWVIHFGRAIVAESYTHALLPGLVLAAALGGGLLWGALLGVVIAWVCLALSARAPRTSLQTANSVTVTMLVAVGALMATSSSGGAQLESLLLGAPVAGDWGDVATAAAFAALVAVVLRLMGSRFAALAFDPLAAPHLGVNAALARATALGLLALSVSVAANVAGTLLALALVIGPALGASAVARRLRSTLFVASLVGAASGLAGVYLSWYTDWPTSASIALALCLWVAAAHLGQRLARPPLHIT